MKLRGMKSSMTQQINLFQNNRSVFRTVIAFVVPKTGLIHVVLVGLMAGRQKPRRVKCFESYNSTFNAFFGIQIDFRNT